MFPYHTSWKHSKKQKFSVFIGYKMGTLARHGLTKSVCIFPLSMQLWAATCKAHVLANDLTGFYMQILWLVSNDENNGLQGVKKENFQELSVILLQNFDKYQEIFLLKNLYWKAKHVEISALK